MSLNELLQQTKDWLLSVLLTATLFIYVAFEQSIAVRIRGGRLILLASVIAVYLIVNTFYWIWRFATMDHVFVLLTSTCFVMFLLIRELGDRGLI